MVGTVNWLLKPDPERINNTWKQLRMPHIIIIIIFNKPIQSIYSYVNEGVMCTTVYWYTFWTDGTFMH